MDELQEEIKEKILQDVTASDVLEFRKHPYTRKDFPKTELFNKLWYSIERELNWREKKSIENMRAVLDEFMNEVRDTQKLKNIIFDLCDIEDLRGKEDIILENICLDILG